MRRSVTFAFAAFAAVLAAAPARAVTYLFDDITANAARTGTAAIGDDAYASFKTGTAGAAMSSLEINLGKSGTGSTGTITVGLYAESGTAGVVGVLLATLGSVTVAGLTTAGAAVTVTSSATYLLAASTRYFIGLIDSGTGGRWGTIDTASGAIGSAGEYHSTTKTGISNSTLPMYLMRVAVPEPASMALLGSGIAGLLMARRRTSRA